MRRKLYYFRSVLARGAANPLSPGRLCVLLLINLKIFALAAHYIG